jgi:hypothetical protein
MRALLLTAVLTTLAAGCVGHAPPRPDPDAPVKRVVPGEYVLGVAPGTSRGAIQSILVDLAPRQIRDLGDEKMLVVFGDDPGLGRLRFRVGEGGILSIEPNTTTAPPKPAR